MVAQHGRLLHTADLAMVRQWLVMRHVVKW
jgi:hypothetical protein